MKNHAESKFPICYIMKIDQMPTDHSFGHPVQIQLYWDLNLHGGNLLPVHSILKFNENIIK